MKLSCLYIFSDNHNVILNVSDRSVDKLASPDKILESVNFIKKSLIEKIYIYINNVYVPHHRPHNRRDRWLIVSPKDTGYVG